jgi:hypothetical protein
VKNAKPVVEWLQNAESDEEWEALLPTGLLLCYASWVVIVVSVSPAV